MTGQDDGASPPKRGRGRPPMPLADRRRHIQKFRVTDEMRDRLMTDAMEGRRSISEEVEHKIATSLVIADEFGTGDRLQLLRYINAQLVFMERLQPDLDYRKPQGLVAIKATVDHVLDQFIATPLNASAEHKAARDASYAMTRSMLSKFDEIRSKTMAMAKSHDVGKAEVEKLVTEAIAMSKTLRSKKA